MMEQTTKKKYEVKIKWLMRRKLKSTWGRRERVKKKETKHRCKKMTIQNEMMLIAQNLAGDGKGVAKLDNFFNKRGGVFAREKPAKG